jgi:hypothetical protein
MQLRINEYVKEFYKRLNPKGPMWKIGRERCNLYKSLIISRLQKNWQTHPSQVICVGATVEMF